MPELPAGTVASFFKSPRNGGCHKAEEEGPKLVSRRESACFLLGAGTCLSPHRPALDELRPARSAAVGFTRGPGEPLETASGKPSLLERRIEKARAQDR